MTGPHRFPTGSRNHSHDRFPVPPLYRGTGTGGGSELLFPFGAGTSQGTAPAPPERADDELYEQWLESDALIDLESDFQDGGVHRLTKPSQRYVSQPLTQRPEKVTTSPNNGGSNAEIPDFV